MTIKKKITPEWVEWWPWIYGIGIRICLRFKGKVKMAKRKWKVYLFIFIFIFKEKKTIKRGEFVAVLGCMSGSTGKSRGPKKVSLSFSILRQCLLLSQSLLGFPFFHFLPFSHTISFRIFPIRVCSFFRLLPILSSFFFCSSFIHYYCYFVAQMCHWDRRRRRNWRGCVIGSSGEDLRLLVSLFFSPSSKDERF